MNNSDLSSRSIYIWSDFLDFNYVYNYRNVCNWYDNGYR